MLLWSNKHCIMLRKSKQCPYDVNFYENTYLNKPTVTITLMRILFFRFFIVLSTFYHCYTIEKMDITTLYEGKVSKYWYWNTQAFASNDWSALIDLIKFVRFSAHIRISMHYPIKYSLQKSGSSLNSYKWVKFLLAININYLLG